MGELLSCEEGKLLSCGEGELLSCMGELLSCEKGELLSRVEGELLSCGEGELLSRGGASGCARIAPSVLGCERVEPDGLTHGEAGRGRSVSNSQANGEFDVERIVPLARSVWLNVGMSGDEDGRGGNAVGGDAGNCTIGADAESRF